MSRQSWPSKWRRRLAGLVCRVVQAPRIAGYRLLSSCDQRGRPVLHQPLHALGLGQLNFDGTVHIGVFPSPHYFSGYAYLEARSPKASISIGDGSWINNNFCAVAEHTSITIGRRVLVGTSVEIYDSDFHGLRVEDRGRSEPDWARPVVIEDDVFIGANVRILKGVTIGQGSVVANGSVVVSSVPPGVVAAGVPARVITQLA